jgi:hypothetical protein
VAEYDRQKIGDVIWEISKNLGMLGVKCLALSSIPCMTNQQGVEVFLPKEVERPIRRSNSTLLAECQHVYCLAPKR